MSETESHVLGPGTAAGPGPLLGGGLCWSALDRYLRGVGISRPAETPEPGDALYAELVRRQVAALEGVWSRARQWQARPDGSWRDRLPIRVFGGRVFGGRDVTTLTRAEWPRIRSSLDTGTPILLTLLEPADGYRRHLAIRQMLATDWKLEDDRIVVSVYDPGRPGNDSVRLSFGSTGPLGARLNDGSEIRGFWATPYDRVVPASDRVESFGDRKVIGLNRPVEGALAAAAGRHRIDLVARNERRALLHFHRSRGESWEGSNITSRDGLGGYELHSDPAIVRSRGLPLTGLHVFARSYVGDLLHFRAGRRWRVTNRTDHKRTGSGFRLAGRPLALAGPRGRLSVLGLDQEGGLIHYAGRPPLGWRAERVPGDALSGDPVAMWANSILHVAATTTAGEFTHREWDGERWTVTGPSSLGKDSGATGPLQGRLALHAAGNAVCLAGRSADDRLVVLYRNPAGTWTASRLGPEVAGDPVLTTGPAGFHLFIPTRAGGILHGWRGDGWCVEELPGTRSYLPALPATTALACWGAQDELRVWGRGDGDLWSLRWRADADWTLERMSDRPGVRDQHRPGDDPTVVADGAGRPHLFFTDGKGTVLHLEPSEWREPRPLAPPAQGASATPGSIDPVKPHTETNAEPQPEPASVSEPAPEPVKGAEPPTEPVEEPVEEPVDQPVEEPASEAEPPAEPARSAGVWAPTDGKDFRWRRGGNAPSPSEFEPMDLSLLDGWSVTPADDPAPAKGEKTGREKGRKES